MLEISEFQDVRLKSISLVEKENGNKRFYFVEFADAKTMDLSGQMMFNPPKDFTTDDYIKLKQLELHPVSAKIELSSYQNRASLRCISISPRNTNK